MILRSMVPMVLCSSLLLRWKKMLLLLVVLGHLKHQLLPLRRFSWTFEDIGRFNGARCRRRRVLTMIAKGIRADGNASKEVLLSQ